MPKIVEITWDQFEALRELGAPVGYDAPPFEVAFSWEYLRRNVQKVHLIHAMSNRWRAYTLVDSDA